MSFRFLKTRAGSAILILWPTPQIPPSPKDGDDTYTHRYHPHKKFRYRRDAYVGLIPASAQGWHLILVGFAIFPVFAMAIQSSLVTGREVWNKITVGVCFFAHPLLGFMLIHSFLLGDLKYPKKLFSELQRDLPSSIQQGHRFSTFHPSSWCFRCAYGVANEAVLFYAGVAFIARKIYTPDGRCS